MDCFSRQVGIAMTKCWRVFWKYNVLIPYKSDRLLVYVPKGRDIHGEPTTSEKIGSSNNYMVSHSQYSSPVTGHRSPVTCHLSIVPCHSCPFAAISCSMVLTRCFKPDPVSWKASLATDAKSKKDASHRVVRSAGRASVPAAKDRSSFKPE